MAAETRARFVRPRSGAATPTAELEENAAAASAVPAAAAHTGESDAHGERKPGNPAKVGAQDEQVATAATTTDTMSPAVDAMDVDEERGRPRTRSADGSPRKAGGRSASRSASRTVSDRRSRSRSGSRRSYSSYTRSSRSYSSYSRSRSYSRSPSSSRSRSYSRSRSRSFSRSPSRSRSPRYRPRSPAYRSRLRSPSPTARFMARRGRYASPPRTSGAGGRWAGRRGRNASRSPPPKPVIKTVRVGPLTPSIGRSHLTEIFSHFGRVVSVQIHKDMLVVNTEDKVAERQITAYVEYGTARDSDDAAECMDGGMIDGQKVAVKLLTEDENLDLMDRTRRAPSPERMRDGSGRGGMDARLGNPLDKHEAMQSKWPKGQRVSPVRRGEFYPSQRKGDGNDRHAQRGSRPESEYGQAGQYRPRSPPQHPAPRPASGKNDGPGASKMRVRSRSPTRTRERIPSRDRSPTAMRD